MIRQQDSASESWVVLEEGSCQKGPFSRDSTGKRHFLAMLQCSFSLVAAQLLVKMTSALQKANVAVQFLQHNVPKIAAQLPFSLPEPLLNSIAAGGTLRNRSDMRSSGPLAKKASFSSSRLYVL